MNMELRTGPRLGKAKATRRIVRRMIWRERWARWKPGLLTLLVDTVGIVLFLIGLFFFMELLMEEAAKPYREPAITTAPVPPVNSLLRSSP